LDPTERHSGNEKDRSTEMENTQGYEGHSFQWEKKSKMGEGKAKRGLKEMYSSGLMTIMITITDDSTAEIDL